MLTWAVVIPAFATLAAGLSEGSRASIEVRAVNRVMELMNEVDVQWPRNPPQDMHGPQATTGLPWDLSTLRSLATSPDPRSRQLAAETLPISATPEELDLLVALLLDEAPLVKDTALNSLKEVDGRALFNTLMRGFSSGNERLLTVFRQVMPELQPKVESVFLETLQSGTTPTAHRIFAAQCLSRMDSDGATDALSRLAWSGDRALAVACAEALVVLEKPTSAKQVLALIHHPIKEVRRLAIHGLAELGGSEAIDALEGIAAGRLERDQVLRREAIALLSVVGDESSVPALIEAGEKTPQLRQAAGAALRRLTGMAFSDAPQEWREWYVAFKQARLELGPPPPLVPHGFVLPKVPEGFVPGMYYEEAPSPEPKESERAESVGAPR